MLIDVVECAFFAEALWLCEIRIQVAHGVFVRHVLRELGLTWHLVPVARFNGQKKQPKNDPKTTSD